MEPNNGKTSISGEAQLSVTKQVPTSSTIASIRVVRTESSPDKRIVLIHGFTQNSHHFLNIAEKLATEYPFEVVCVDLPGHGDSSDLRLDLDATSQLLFGLGTDSIWVGYSLGARQLLNLCIGHPEVTWRAIFSGVNPGIEVESQRLERIRSDAVLAHRLNSMKGDPEGFREFLREWMQMPIFLPRSIDSSDLKYRLLNDPGALASSLELCGIAKQKNLWPHIAELKGNVALLTGGCDRKYLEIADRFRSELTGSDRVSVSTETIEGFGHAAIFDQPEKLVDAITRLA